MRLLSIGFFSLSLFQATVVMGADRTLEELIVVGVPNELSQFDVPMSVSVIKEREIREHSYRSLPQALRNIPGVLVQETAFGQGSPFIRGFTGFRNVLLVDGIRVNNSVFREGPNQYWATVDALSLDRIEVINGPSSVIYGSDAIGGAVYARTRALREDRSNVFTRLSSAERSYIAGSNFAWLLGNHSAIGFGLSKKKFGDLEGGDEVGRQVGVGYDEWQGDVKWRTKLGDWGLTLYHQVLRQDDVPRTHKTIDSVSWEGTSVGSEIYRRMDQHRRLTYARVENSELDSVLNRLSFTASYTYVEEVRDRLRSGNRRDIQGMEVGTYGLQVHGGRDNALGELSFGVDYYRDDVDSFSTSNFIQGPVGDDARYESLDIYVQNVASIADFDITAGLRHTSVDARADRVRDPVNGSQISIDKQWDQTVARLGLAYDLVPSNVKLFAGISQGFRAPNLSDMTRFSSARSNEFEIPSPDLEPEKFLSYELGLKYQGEHSAFQLSAYYTDIDDMIQRFPTGNIVDGEFEITRDNIGEGFVQGVELFARRDMSSQWYAYTRLNWMDGEVSTYPTSQPILVDEPIDRRMPLTASLGLRYQHKDNIWFETQVDYADKADTLSTRDKADTSRIPPGGTPGYSILHARMGYKVNTHVDLVFIVDNLLNEDYRVHGSGTNMPGRNFIARIDIGF